MARNVIYWPSTKSSIKRCTCVNKQKNSGSRWTLDNNITRCPDGSSQVATGCRSENQLQAEDFGPSVTHGLATKTKMRKKCCYGWGRTWVNIAVCPPLHSFLTHNKYHPFENKVWEIYIKKCIRSLLKSFIIGWLFLHIFEYVYEQLYVVIQQKGYSTLPKISGLDPQN